MAYKRLEEHTFIWPAIKDGLPRIEEVITPDSTTCGCGAERHVIGEDVSERLDIIPARFQPGSGLSSPGVPNMPAGPARMELFRLRHRRG